MGGGSEHVPGSERSEGPPGGGGADPGGGPPAEHLREFLRERFGDVPPESPSEPQHLPDEDDRVEGGGEGTETEEGGEPPEEEAV